MTKEPAFSYRASTLYARTVPDGHVSPAGHRPVVSNAPVTENVTPAADVTKRDRNCDTAGDGMSRFVTKRDGDSDPFDELTSGDVISRVLDLLRRMEGLEARVALLMGERSDPTSLTQKKRPMTAKERKRLSRARLRGCDDG